MFLLGKRADFYVYLRLVVAPSSCSASNLASSTPAPRLLSRSKSRVMILSQVLSTKTVSLAWIGAFHCM